jgi:4-amino-4-deoxy-L-arabinose transferase-like glycosyltransferase
MLDSTIREPIVYGSPVSDTNQPKLETPLSPPAKIGWIVLIAVTLFVCYFSHLGAIGFVGPDEPRYAWIARAMVETGDWVTPRLYGQPWFEKPPLFYWGAALSFKLFGVSEAAARLPSAISALLATLAMGWLAWRMYSAETARWLLLLLPTTVGMIGFSHAAATDMPFSAMLTIAMVCAALVLQPIPPRTCRGGACPSSADTAANIGQPAPSQLPHSTKTPWLALFLFGFFLGLAVLAKGPAGIVLCGGTVFFWALFTKRWRDAFRLLQPAAIVAFCVTALPWYILCARRNPDFLRIFIIEHNFKRYLTPEFQHLQPFWFYLPVVLAALLPWSIFSAWAAASGAARLWRSRNVNHFSCLLLCWILFSLLFFTISRSKLPGYILPCLPPLVLLTAGDIALRLRRNSDRALFCFGGLTLILLGVLVWHLRDRIPFVTDIRLSPGIVQFVMLSILGGALALVLALRRMTMASTLVMVAAMLSFLTLDTGDLWQLDDGVSARPVVTAALQHITSEQAAAATVFKLRRAYKYQVDFYLQRETSDLSPEIKQDSTVFTDHQNSAELIRLGGWCPHYLAFPVVWVCEYSNNGQVLMDHAARGGQPQ